MCKILKKGMILRVKKTYYSSVVSGQLIEIDAFLLVISDVYAYIINSNIECVDVLYVTTGKQGTWRYDKGTIFEEISKYHDVIGD